MLRVKYALCAEGIVRDATTNSITAYNILEEVNAIGFPVVMPRLAIVVAVERESTDSSQQSARLRITLGDHELLSHALSLDFQEKLINRAIISLQGLVIPAAGTLVVSFSALDASVAISLPVQTISPQQLPLTFVESPVLQGGS